MTHPEWIARRLAERDRRRYERAYEISRRDDKHMLLTMIAAGALVLAIAIVVLALIGALDHDKPAAVVIRDGIYERSIA